jgi:peptide/nickel transport system substrate-binding protein
MQSRDMEWWEQPSADLMPLLIADHGLKTTVLDRTGNMGIMRPNFLYPPFNNPAICRALLGAIDQKDFMIAVNGEDPSGWHVPVGVYPPQSPMATDVGMSVLTGPRDLDKVRRDLIAAGYKGERVALMAATDFPILIPLANVAADMLRKVGMNVDFQATDWGTIVERRASKNPPDQGGWNLFFTYLTGLDEFNPAVDVSLRGNGAAGWFGWPTMPKLDQLRSAWVDAPDLPTQKKIAAEIQQQVFDNPPFFRLGQMFQPTAYSSNLSGMLTGLPIFWNLRRA